MDEIVIRKNIQDLTKKETSRFVEAMKRLMIREKNEDKSLYRKIAEIHRIMCSHGLETFPGWHRIYLLLFERMLQEADRKNGNDGLLGLPYWDWEKNQSVPSIILEKFSTLPKHLKVNINRGDPSFISHNLRYAYLSHSMNGAMSLPEHWRFASTRWNGPNLASLESIHNSVHIACGYPMGDVPMASFDPIFWLHHSNVDRIYETYLFSHPTSKSQFKKFQKYRFSVGDLNRYLNPLKPFTFPLSKKYVYPRHTFKTDFFMYKYDKLRDQDKYPSLLNQNTSKDSIFVFFEDIDVLKLEGKSYQLHIFIFDKDDPLKIIPNNQNNYGDHKNYCGMGAIFSRGEDCLTCRSKNLLQIFVDVSLKVKSLQIKIPDMVLKVICIETSSKYLKKIELESLPIPIPTIIGPMFIDEDHVLEYDINDNLKDTSNKDDILMLKKYLYWSGGLNYESFKSNRFCLATDTAVKALQKCLGIRVDGKVGNVTKKYLLNSRCGFVEDVKLNDMTLINRIKSDDEQIAITYWIGSQPSNMNRLDMLYEISKTFDKWERLLGIRFLRVKREKGANIKILWTHKVITSKSKYLPFHGRGIVIANTIENIIYFDYTNVWRLFIERDKFPPAKNEYYLMPSLLHQIGHSIGLNEHSDDIDNAMNPFYDSYSVSLDKLRINH